MKKILTFIIIVASLLCLVSCGKEEVSEGELSTRQIDGPVAGDTIATFTVKDYGEFSVVLFPEVAPKAVENFVTHAKDGYYNGVTFHRVIEDFMIQGGDPEGTGAGGESIWGGEFEDEFDYNFLPIRGALCMANYGEPGTNGSQFFIVTLGDCYEDYLSGCSEEQKERFREYGGASWLIEAHTVFGQVYEGMDVVDDISVTAVDSSNSRPLKDVIIENIAISEY